MNTPKKEESTIKEGHIDDNAASIKMKMQPIWKIKATFLLKLSRLFYLVPRNKQHDCNWICLTSYLIVTHINFIYFCTFINITPTLKWSYAGILLDICNSWAHCCMYFMWKVFIYNLTIISLTVQCINWVHHWYTKKYWSLTYYF